MLEDCGKEGEKKTIGACRLGSNNVKILEKIERRKMEKIRPTGMLGLAEQHCEAEGLRPHKRSAAGQRLAERVTGSASSTSGGGPESEGGTDRGGCQRQGRALAECRRGGGRGNGEPALGPN